MPSQASAAPSPLPRAYMTPACRTGGDRWPDLHHQCSAPGYQNQALGWVPVSCACSCHDEGEVSGS